MIMRCAGAAFGVFLALAPGRAEARPMIHCDDLPPLKESPHRAGKSRRAAPRIAGCDAVKGERPKSCQAEGRPFAWIVFDGNSYRWTGGCSAELEGRYPFVADLRDCDAIYENPACRCGRELRAPPKLQHVMMCGSGGPGGGEGDDSGQTGESSAPGCPYGQVWDRGKWTCSHGAGPGRVADFGTGGAEGPKEEGGGGGGAGGPPACALGQVWKDGAWACASPLSTQEPSRTPRELLAADSGPASTEQLPCPVGAIFMGGRWSCIQPTPDTPAPGGAAPKDDAPGCPDGAVHQNGRWKCLAGATPAEATPQNAVEKHCPYGKVWKRKRWTCAPKPKLDASPADPPEPPPPPPPPLPEPPAEAQAGPEIPNPLAGADPVALAPPQRPREPDRRRPPSHSCPLGQVWVDGRCMTMEMLQQPRD
ncbi:MAG: hypothetical protein HY553_12805 [Elusimicrobia bacterium]|nr:hypothetical protein [Elusimicrobiota bacterium]